MAYELSGHTPPEYIRILPMKTYTTIYSVDVVGTMAQPLSPYAPEI